MLELFNSLDWLIIVAAAIFVARGLSRGFASELGSLVALFISIVGGIFLYQPVADFLRRVVGRPDFWWETIAFVACFLVIYLFIQFIAGRMGKVFYKSSISFFNRIIGALIGLLKGVIVCFVIINLLIMAHPYTKEMNHEYLQQDWVANSYLSPTVIKCGNFLLGFISSDFVIELPDNINNYNPNLNYNPSIPQELDNP